jgi:hypothetical protein
MRKFASLVLIGVVAWLGISPADSSAADWKGGILVGFNISYLSGSETWTFHGSGWFARFCLCGGGRLAAGLSKNLAIQAEAIVTMKGSHQLSEWGGEPDPVKYFVKTLYLEFPLLLRLSTTPSSDGTSFYGVVGPAPAVLLSGQLMRDSETLPFEGFGTTDLGLILGAGMVLKTHGIVELRYSRGLHSIIEENGVPLDIKNGVFSLIAGYLF